MTNSSSPPPINRRRLMQSLGAVGLMAGCDGTVPAAPRSTSIQQSPPTTVAHWTHVLAQAVRTSSMPPPAAARAFAMAHTAGFVAANGVNPRYATPYAVGAGPVGANADAAYAAAVARVASLTFGQNFTPTLAAFLQDTGTSDSAAVQWGVGVGNHMTAARQHDGARNAGTLDSFRYPKMMDTMGWVPTGAGRPALLPGWGKVRPWVIGDARSFLPRAFPAQNSAEFARQLRKVRAIGGANSTVRTADQTQTAYFWLDGPGGVSPPGHWQLIALNVLGARGFSTPEFARVMAMLSMAQADAAIATWDSKYYFDILRPETAIRKVGGDPNWRPLIPSPAFPAYTSGHSMFSGASARILGLALGTDAVSFSGSSPDPHLWPAQLNGVRRSWTSLSAAAAENGASREYGGVHWEADNTEGLRISRRIADAVFQRAFMPR